LEESSADHEKDSQSPGGDVISWEVIRQSFASNDESNSSELSPEESKLFELEQFLKYLGCGSLKSSVDQSEGNTSGLHKEVKNSSNADDQSEDNQFLKEAESSTDHAKDSQYPGGDPLELWEQLALLKDMNKSKDVMTNLSLNLEILEKAEAQISLASKHDFHPEQKPGIFLYQFYQIQGKTQ